MVETQAKEKLAREKDTLQTEYNELQEKLKVWTLSSFPPPSFPKSLLSLSQNPPSQNPPSPSPQIPPSQCYVVTEV